MKLPKKVKAARLLGQRGAVLLEYVILLCCVVLPLVFFRDGVRDILLFKPTGALQGDFGDIGNSFHSFYTNLVTGICQPIP